MRILGLSGSLRPGSYNTMLLGAAAAVLPPEAELVRYAGLADLPAFCEDIAAPESVDAFRAAIAEADAVLVATPEYNASIPGALKNALDWASRPFPGNALQGKPAAVVGASTGLFGAVWAQAEARKVLARIGARVVDEELPVGRAADAFTADGDLADPDLAAALRAILEQLVDTPVAAAA